MENVLIRGYANINLGDDLFFYILIERYNANFKIEVKHDYKKILGIKTIQYEYSIIRLINYIASVLSKNNYLIAPKKSIKNVEHCDLVVYIGGSVFIENASWKYNYIIRDYTASHSNTYMIGMNFGPYKTKEFLEINKNLFSKVKDVCFRDEYSSQLFDNKYRYAPDVVFNLNNKRYFQVKC